MSFVAKVFGNFRSSENPPPAPASPPPAYAATEPEKEVSRPASTVGSGKFEGSDGLATVEKNDVEVGELTLDEGATRRSPTH